jgi:hypothetical protein
MGLLMVSCRVTTGGGAVELLGIANGCRTAMWLTEGSLSAAHSSA